MGLGMKSEDEEMIVTAGYFSYRKERIDTSY
jgi:hypothetical protein